MWDKLVCNSTCGDAMRAGLEECDDGNVEDGDGCTADCKFEDIAGINGTADGTWECTAQDSTLPVNGTESGNKTSARRAAPICYRDICKRTALYQEIEGAKAVAQAVTAAVASVVAGAVASAVGGAVAGAAAGAAGGAAGGEH
jgi:cysteine-rich repeat protein